MPATKAAFLRYEIIDECLRNGMRRWSKMDILNCVNSKLKERHGGEDGQIAESSLRKDLEDMKTEYGAPIETYTEGRKHYYRYDDQEWSIKKLPVNNDDLARLNLAVDILQQIHGFALADEVAEIVQRLEKKLKVAGQKKAVIAFENPPTAQGTENLGDIYQAILNENVLKISYKHYWATEPLEQIIHPYYLKEFNNRWYLFGWSEQNIRIETMALDRMLEIKVTNNTYRENSFNPGAYFDKIIGVTDMGTPVESIQLLFNKNRAPYIISRKLHSSQREKELEDGKVLVELDLKINRELIALILGYGEDVEVISPNDLKTAIIENLKKAVEKYHSDFS
jgi:predicted DNA-binding transcriptional regulator YafY